MAGTEAERSRVNPGMEWASTLLLTLNYLVASTKPRIALAAALSSIPGFVLAWRGRASPPGSWFGSIVVLSAGIFLLSSGAALLNNLQDRNQDSHALRTRLRPLASGLLSPWLAAAFVFGSIVPGLALLYSLCGIHSAALGLLAIFLYNGVYTPLKRITAFALIPGALVGAIPPLIGNSAGHGGWSNAALYSLAGFYLIWQIPHTFLIYLKYGKDYAPVPIPTMGGLLGEQGLLRITLIWLWATAVYALQLPLYWRLRSPALTLLVCLFAVWLLRDSSRIWRVVREQRDLRQEERRGVIAPLFMRLNLFSFALGVLLSSTLLSEWL